MKLSELTSFDSDYVACKFQPVCSNRLQMVNLKRFWQSVWYWRH